MGYPKIPNFRDKVNQFCDYVNLKHEYGAVGLSKAVDALEAALNAALAEIKAWPEDEALRSQEPDAYADILRLRPEGPRRMWQTFDAARYAERLEGALLARMAGCTLGAIVEGWSVKGMEDWAAYLGQKFPPEDYWTAATNPHYVRYGKDRCVAYTKDGMHYAPVDDDIAYTVLGLLIAEDHGPDFTVEDVAKAWVKYLPI